MTDWNAIKKTAIVQTYDSQDGRLYRCYYMAFAKKVFPDQPPMIMGGQPVTSIKSIEDAVKQAWENFYERYKSLVLTPITEIPEQFRDVMEFYYK